jgi:hypothetical protein
MKRSNEPVEATETGAHYLSMKSGDSPGESGLRASPVRWAQEDTL